MKKYNSTLRILKNLKGMNLQLFTEEEPVEQEKPVVEQNGKTYSQEELQSETDKRVTQALKTAKEKWQKEYETKLEEEKKEVERLSKLSAEEKEKELLKQQQQQLEEKEKAIQFRELQLDTIKILEEENLPVGFAEFLIKNDAETTNENIKKFKDEWQQAIEKAIDLKLKGNTPKVGSTNVNENTLNLSDLANQFNITK